MSEQNGTSAIEPPRLAHLFTRGEPTGIHWDECDDRPLPPGCVCEEPVDQRCPACGGTGDHWDRETDEWGDGKCRRCEGWGEIPCPVHS